ncbi:RNA polymerase II-associated protein 3 [Cichlidogyrus casuarinus]|uniref:RNA polymerase II-associated protein 3 n=1 Tax=Cichlidogyrus casuarinus TaxID=1844966 RepID=A0ABD2Q6R7_9PLAT
MFAAKYDGCEEASTDSESSNDQNQYETDFNENKDKIRENFTNIVNQELDQHISFLKAYYGGSELEEDLLYDEKEDEENATWMIEKFGTRDSSDATLNCPGCLTCLTTQSQRHQHQNTLYRAVNDPSKFVELQKQMRENNEVLGDFLKDMNDWKNDVDMKYKKLSNSDKQLPPIRNSLLTKKKKRVKKTQPLPEEKQVRIKSGDYAKWDKFDVDKALEELDNNNQVSEESDEEDDEEWEELRRQKLSDEAKEEGNIYFRKSDFVSAIEKYTKAIQYTPSSAVLYSNRAMAQLKLDQYAAAEVDCTSAISLDSKMAKAYFRRALARKNLNRRNEAIEDLVSSLKIDPKNLDSMKQLELLRTAVSTRNWVRVPIQEVSPQKPPADLTKVIRMAKKDVKLGTPDNYYQFERDLRELETDAEKEEYIRKIPSQKYKSIFGNNLTEQNLSKILSALVTKTPEEALQALEQLSQVTRFDLVWMLASSQDRQRVSAILDQLPPERTTSVKNAFTS